MAVKPLKNETKYDKKQKHSILLAFIIFVFVCVIAVGCALNYAQAAKNNREASEVSKQCDAVIEENKELESFLDSKNHDEYYEKIAREKFDYAKPGERVFYDSSFGN